MDLSAVRALLLDMDGTLVSSDAAVSRAWRRWSEEYEVDPDTAVRVGHGRPAADTVQLLRPDLDHVAATAAGRRQLALQYQDLSDVAATAGAEELLSVLGRRRLPWAVVTSADRRLAAARLSAAGITAGVVVTSEDVTTGKPDPEGYRLAADRLRVDVRQCLVVEDAPAGVVAGRAAGAMVAALRGIEADVTLADLGELARLLEGRPTA